MEENNKEIINQSHSEDEIDLIEIAAKLWANRRFIIKVTAIFAAIGLFIAIFTPNEYTATTTMVPQTGDKGSGGNLSGLAAMAGINLGSINSGEVLSPSVYPKILNNVNFQKELIYSEYNFSKADKPISYFEYLTNKKYRSFDLLRDLKKYTLGLPSIIIGLFKNNNEDNYIINTSNGLIYSLSNKENRIVKEVLKKLSLNINNKDGYITLSFTSEEPRISAEIVQKVQNLLQKFITEFKLEKVRNNLEFVEKSYDEAKENFERKQAELARFRDANKSLTSALAKTQEEQLTSEYNLLLGVYTELAKQKEQAKIAVNETTPILTIIEPVAIPTEKSGPKKTFLLVVTAFLGFTLSAIWTLMHRYLFYQLNRILNYN